MAQAEELDGKQELSRDDKPRDAGYSRYIRPWVALLLIIFTSACWRIYLFLNGRLGFDSDQAIPGIGALRILREGKHHLMFPGQDYAGDFWSYYFLPLHMIFTPSAAVMRHGMLPFSLLMVVGSFYAARSVFRAPWPAVVVALLMAFPPSMVMDWFQRASSIYIAPITALLFCIPIVLRLTGDLLQDGWSAVNVRRAALIGFLMGFSYWAHPTGLIYLVAILVFWFMQPRVALAFGGFTAPGKMIHPIQNRWKLWVYFIIQTVMLLALAITTKRLWLGSHALQQGNLPRALGKLYVSLAITGGIGVAYLALLKYIRPVPWISAVAAPCFILALWLGSAPYFCYTYGAPGRGSDPGGTSLNMTVTFNKLHFIIFSGLPVLFGHYHNWKVPFNKLPSAVNMLVLGIYYVSIICTVLAVCFQWIRGRRREKGLFFLIILSAVLVVLVSLSRAAYSTNEPRYLLILYFAAVVMLVSSLAYMGRHLKTAGIVFGAAVVGLILFFNFQSCLYMPSKVVDDYSGASVTEKALLKKLTDRGITRVNCHFTPHGYWAAYRFAYLSNETILFSHFNPLGRYNRSQRYADEVAMATNTAYLVDGLPYEKALESYLRGNNVRYEHFKEREFRVFYNLQPDVLKGLKPGMLMTALAKLEATTASMERVLPR